MQSRTWGSLSDLPKGKGKNSKGPFTLNPFVYQTPQQMNKLEFHCADPVTRPRLNVSFTYSTSSPEISLEVFCLSDRKVLNCSQNIMAFSGLKRITLRQVICVLRQALCYVPVFWYDGRDGPAMTSQHFHCDVIRRVFQQLTHGIPVHCILVLQQKLLKV